MRYVPLILIAFIPLSSGCSGLIARSGKDLAQFATAEQVHKSFGEPLTTSTENGKLIETYRTHRKICDNSLRTASL